MLKETNRKISTLQGEFIMHRDNTACDNFYRGRHNVYEALSGELVAKQQAVRTGIRADRTGTSSSFRSPVGRGRSTLRDSVPPPESPLSDRGASVGIW